MATVPAERADGPRGRWSTPGGPHRCRLACRTCTVTRHRREEYRRPLCKASGWGRPEASAVRPPV